MESVKPNERKRITHKEQARPDPRPPARPAHGRPTRPRRPYRRRPTKSPAFLLQLTPPPVKFPASGPTIPTPQRPRRRGRGGRRRRWRGLATRTSRAPWPRTRRQPLAAPSTRPATPLSPDGPRQAPLDGPYRPPPPMLPLLLVRLIAWATVDLCRWMTALWLKWSIWRLLSSRQSSLSVLTHCPMRSPWRPRRLWRHGLARRLSRARWRRECLNRRPLLLALRQQPPSAPTARPSGGFVSGAVPAPPPRVQSLLPLGSLLLLASVLLNLAEELWQRVQDPPPPPPPPPQKE
ncbi:hypothetical protein BC828DRAFT_377123, partial [Blastocladiella britannica]